jgi:hypothetical protein
VHEGVNNFWPRVYTIYYTQARLSFSNTTLALTYIKISKPRNNIYSNVWLIIWKRNLIFQLNFFTILDKLYIILYTLIFLSFKRNTKYPLRVQNLKQTIAGRWKCNYISICGFKSENYRLDLEIKMFWNMHGLYL